MRRYIDKHVRINIAIGSDILTYSAVVNGVDDTHIHFTDKFDKAYSFRLADVIQVEEVKG